MERIRGGLHVNEDLSLTGGAEKMVRQIGIELDRRGLKVGLVSAHEFTDHTSLREYVIPSFNGHYASKEIPKLAQSVTDIMDEQGYDLLHVYSVSNNELIQEIAKSKPVFRSVYDSRSFCPTENRIKAAGNICTELVGVNCLECMEQFNIPDTGRKTRLIQTISGLNTMNSYELIFTPSEYVRQQLILNNVNPNKIKVIPFFLTDFDHNDSTGEIDPSGEYKSDILFSGRLIEPKGINELFEAFDLLPGFQLTVVGERPLYTTPRDFSKERNKFKGRVKFTGWVANSIIDRYYQGTSVCVVPSMWPEAFGLVGLEAMKNGKPVVAFDTGGISEWLHDGVNGYLIPRGNVELFAEKVEFLLKNPELAQRMGRHGHEMLLTVFTAQNHINQLLHYYLETLK